MTPRLLLGLAGALALAARPGRAGAVEHPGPGDLLEADELSAADGTRRALVVRGGAPGPVIARPRISAWTSCVPS